MRENRARSDSVTSRTTSSSSSSKSFAISFLSEKRVVHCRIKQEGRL